MFFYILLVVLVLLLFIFSYNYPKKDQICSLILLGGVIVIGGFRDRIGWDYDSYISWYLNGTRDDGFEFGFLALMEIFRYFKIDYHFLFFFFSFFTYFFLYLGIRKYTQKSTLPLFIYLLVPILFLSSFTYIRQSLSVSIAFYAFSFLLNRQYFKYIVLMLIGVSIHYSCFIPFVLFFLIYKLEKFITIKKLLILIVLSFVTGQIGVIHLLGAIMKNTNYMFYVSNDFIVAVSFLKLIGLNALAIFILWFYENFNYKNIYLKYLLAAYISSVIILNVFCESTDLTRIYMYFRIFEIILISDIIYRLILQNKKIFLIIIFCFYLFSFFRALKVDYYTTTEKLRFIPYKSLLI